MYISDQDADTNPKLPQLKGVLNPDGSQYKGTRAWKDIYDSIKNAKKFIYITGWSVYTEINLLRGITIFYLQPKGIETDKDFFFSKLGMKPCK